MTDPDDEKFEKLYKQFLRFFEVVNKTLPGLNIEIEPAELWFLTKFIVYLWGASIDESVDNFLEHGIFPEKEKEKFDSYARTLFPTSLVSGSNACLLLSVIRKRSYMECLSGEASKLNIRSFDYTELLEEGFDFMVHDSTANFQLFSSAFDAIIRAHHPIFNETIGPLFDESYFDKRYNEDIKNRIVKQSKDFGDCPNCGIVRWNIIRGHLMTKDHPRWSGNLGKQKWVVEAKVPWSSDIWVPSVEMEWNPFHRENIPDDEIGNKVWLLCIRCDNCYHKIYKNEISSDLWDIIIK